MLFNYDRQRLLKIDLQLILKIDPQAFFKIWSANVTEKVIHETFSKMTHKH